jgi:putative membrane protein
MRNLAIVVVTIMLRHPRCLGEHCFDHLEAVACVHQIVGVASAAHSIAASLTGERAVGVSEVRGPVATHSIVGLSGDRPRQPRVNVPIGHDEHRARRRLSSQRKWYGGVFSAKSVRWVMRRRIALVILALPATTLPALAQQDYGPWRMHEWMMGWGGGGMWFGPLWMLVWLAVLVAIIVALVRWLNPAGGETRTLARSARDVLDERYARGEIDRDEYLKRRQDISGS